jgi:hypothetical protein
VNELELFSGAGGGILASEYLIGHTCVCAVELEDGAREMLMARQDDGTLPPFPTLNAHHLAPALGRGRSDGGEIISYG